MHPETIDRLIEINQIFYTRFGEAFALTRRRIQPGIAHIITQLPAQGRWLDLGCGSGALAVHWAETGHSGSYTGIDFSPELLNEASKEFEAWQKQQMLLAKPSPSRPPLQISFQPADLSAENWSTPFSDEAYDGIFCFAVLHHIPSEKYRSNLFIQARKLLKPTGKFIFSVWQYQNSSRFKSRQLDWEKAGIKAEDIEEGDILLDWRFSLAGQQEKTGMRYVHIFQPAELDELARQSGFRVLDSFYSDGKEGNLGLYHIWEPN